MKPLRAKTTINRVVTDKGGVRLGPKRHQIGQKIDKNGHFCREFRRKNAFFAI